nr:hypothetical protein [Asticcacaulis sp.]
MAVGYIEFGLAHGVDQIIGLMPTLILRSVFERAGLTLERLGSPRAIGAHARIPGTVRCLTDKTASSAQDLIERQESRILKPPYVTGVVGLWPVPAFVIS